MKTVFYCHLVLVSIWAQGLFAQANFFLNNGRLVQAPVFDAQGVPLAGPAYLAELWGGASSNSLAPLRVSCGPNRLIIPFRSNGLFGNGVSQLCVCDVPPHGWAWLEVRAWEADLGATYEKVAALGVGGYGESALFYAQGGDPSDMLGLPGDLIGLRSFSLLPVVPEPSTWALLAIGGLGLGWAVRRKRREAP